MLFFLLLLVLPTLLLLMLFLLFLLLLLSLVQFKRGILSLELDDLLPEAYEDSMSSSTPLSSPEQPCTPTGPQAAAQVADLAIGLLKAEKDSAPYPPSSAPAAAGGGSGGGGGDGGKGSEVGDSKERAHRRGAVATLKAKVKQAAVVASAAKTAAKVAVAAGGEAYMAGSAGNAAAAAATGSSGSGGSGSGGGSRGISSNGRRYAKALSQKIRRGRMPSDFEELQEQLEDGVLNLTALGIPGMEVKKVSGEGEHVCVCGGGGVKVL